MPGLTLSSVEALTMLALCACIAGAAIVARALYRSAVERNSGLAREAALGAVMLLVSSTAFFNHQPQRRIERASPPWMAPCEPVEAVSREDVERRAEAQSDSRLEHGLREDEQRRPREGAQRELRLHQIAVSRDAPQSLATR